MPNWYSTLADFREVAIGDATDTSKDTRLRRAMEDIARLIDMEVGGHFYVWNGTRYFTAICGEHLRVPGLLAVTGLKTDDGTRTYPNTWVEADDWDLSPESAPYQSPPFPYEKILIRSNGSWSFPVDLARAAQVTGRFGQYDVRASLTTLAEAITDVGALTLKAPTGKLKIGHTILIDSEQFFIDAVSVASPNDTATVIRPMNGTTAATHLINALIQVYQYPLIEQAYLLQADRSYRRADTPFGMKGDGPGGGVIWVRELDPDVKERINMFKIPGGLGR